jgi:hypothetical protein
MGEEIANLATAKPFVCMVRGYVQNLLADSYYYVVFSYVANVALASRSALPICSFP